jgi:hypothetical protein
MWRLHEGISELIAPLGLRPEPVPVSANRRVSRLKMSRALRFRPSDLERATKSAEKLGKVVTGWEIRPDGTIAIQFGEVEAANDWRAGSPLYEASDD